VRIEQLANVQLSARGNQLAIAGSSVDARGRAQGDTGLYERLKRGLSIELADIDAAVRFARTGGRCRRREWHPHAPPYRAGTFARPARLSRRLA
jgi:hypothetical protein